MGMPTTAAQTLYMGPFSSLGTLISITKVVKFLQECLKFYYKKHYIYTYPSLQIPFGSSIKIIGLSDNQVNTCYNGGVSLQGYKNETKIIPDYELQFSIYYQYAVLVTSI